MLATIEILAKTEDNAYPQTPDLPAIAQGFISKAKFAKEVSLRQDKICGAEFFKLLRNLNFGRFVLLRKLFSL